MDRANRTNNNFTNNLKVLSINVNSLISNFKRLSLLEVIEEKKPDIVTLSETKLNQRHTLFFKNYNCIRNDRPNKNRGGGTAIIIKKGIKFNVINLNNNDKILEKTIISIKLKTNKMLYIISVYTKKEKTIRFHQRIKKFI